MCSVCHSTHKSFCRRVVAGAYTIIRIFSILMYFSFAFCTLSVNGLFFFSRHSVRTDSFAQEFCFALISPTTRLFIDLCCIVLAVEMDADRIFISIAHRGYFA